MSGGADGLFPLEVEPDELEAAADRLTSLREDLEGERSGVAAAPGQWASGWQGGAATAVGAEATALADHMADFPGHLDAAVAALTGLATTYRDAQEAVAALRTRWADAGVAYSDALASSRARYSRDLDAIPAGAGQQTGMYREEAGSAARAREADAAEARTGEQASGTAESDHLLAELRTATRAAGEALAGAVVVPVSDETVSAYLATGVLDLGPVPPSQLADLSLAQQHQVAEDLERVTVDVEQDVAAGELDAAALDELDALLAFTGDQVLLADAARAAREGVAGAMADAGRRAGDRETDPEQRAADVLLVGALLERYQDDEDMTTPFLVDLGPAGTLDLTRASDRWSDVDEPQENPYLATAVALRAALMTSSRDSRFPSTSFAQDLVQRAADAMGGQFEGYPGVALSFLLDGPQDPEDGQDGYGSYFLAAAVDEMAAQEQAYADELGHGDDGAALWQQGGPTHFSQLTGLFADYPDLATDDGRATESTTAWDPMLSAVRQLEDDALAGRQVLQGETGDYLFSDRGWAHDGFTAVVAAGTAAATDAVPGTADWDDASVVASTMVNGLGRHEDLTGNHPFRLEASSTAQLAHVLATHMPAVQEAVIGSTPREGGAVDRGHVNAALGTDPLTTALFDFDALEAVTGLAAQHSDGVAVLREGLNRYQGLLAEGTATQALDPEVVSDPQTFLDDQMGYSGSLEAFVGNAVGQQAEMLGWQQDEVKRFWVETASFGVEQGNAALGAVPHPAAKLGSIVVGEVSDRAFEAMKEAWANGEGTVATESEEAAQLSADRVSYGFMQALHNAEVIAVEGLPPSALDADGRLVDWAELSPEDASRVMNRFANDYSGPVTASSAEVDAAMREEQLPFYEDWVAG